jgi:probable F420-dependent oxidoreductase
MARMQIGVVFPTLEVTDPGAVRDYAQAVEGLGYAHLTAWEHVVGVDLTNRSGWMGPPTLVPIHEPLVLFGYLAAVTRRLELVTGVLALPQRQTVLVAKQAAEVDVLSGGRLRLGVGLGWAEPEYQALGASFTDRGQRVQEQITVLRALFTQEVVAFSGRWHQLEDVGIAPLPIQRPIPIWIGGQADAALRRVAALGAGWMPMIGPQQAQRDGHVSRLRRYAQERGRDPASIGLDPILSLTHGGPVPEGTGPLRPPAAWVEDVQAWQALGATHLSVNTMGAGFPVSDHLDAIGRFKHVVEAAVER